MVERLIPGRDPISGQPVTVEAKRSALRAEIDRLEQRQPRAVRETLLGLPGAKAKLKEIDDNIALCRAQLADI